MSPKTKEIINLIDMLPDNEQDLAFELIKRMVLAWDPDFTKVTPAEKEVLEQIEKEISLGEYVRDDDINWD